MLPASAGAKSLRMSACQVGGDDRVDAFRPQHHPGGHRIDQFLVEGDIGEVAAGLDGDLVPHHHAVTLGVRFGHERQVLARARARQFECEPHDPADPVRVKDCRPGGDFLRKTAMVRPPLPAYSPSLFLADDDPVEIGRPAIAQRAGDAGSIRVGRTLAYWSSPWQIGSRRPHRVR